MTLKIWERKVSENQQRRKTWENGCPWGYGLGLDRRQSSQYSSLLLTSRFRCLHSTCWRQPRGGPSTLPQACATTAGTASHLPRSMWDTACPGTLGRSTWHQARSHSQRAYRCKASPARALPELAFSEQQGQALPRLLWLSSCYPNDKKKESFSGERCACMEALWSMCAGVSL